MLDPEEQVQQQLPIPLPKRKFGSPGESDEETDEDIRAATPNASNPVDGDLEVPSSSTQSLADQIHALTARFDAYWDELQEHRVVLSQDMDSILAEMAAIRASQDQITQQLAQLLSFHTAPPPPPPQSYYFSSGTYFFTFLLYFLFSAIEDTVSFKFEGVGVWGMTMYDLVYFDLFLV